MGKLIDADKLLTDLKDKKKSLRGLLNYAKREGETKWADELREQMQMLTWIIYGIEHGGYDPDPTPSPTIKPGDEDYITAYIINTTEGMFFNTTGVYGHFNWEYLSDFIKKHQDNDGPYELTKIAKRYPGKEIHFKFGLRYVNTEYQYNDTDSPPFVIPGYYLPTNIIVTEIL